MTKAPGEKSSVLGRSHWSRFASTGWKTGTRRFQPVLNAGFPVVPHLDQPEPDTVVVLATRDRSIDSTDQSIREIP